jgi:3-methyladenine DNA glycosylase AlkC
VSAAPLKHGLGPPAIRRLAAAIQSAWPDFDSEGFAGAAAHGLERLELKQRVAHVAERLGGFLPAEYPRAVEILVRAAEGWDDGEKQDPLRGFAAWPLFHFIEQRGTEHAEKSMAALESLTHLFSGEFAVRPYIARYPGPAFLVLARWAEHDSEHVRRLASEGCRPRLPWATRIPALIEDPTPVIGLLERLKDDPSLCVRRSVGNNLNDIAKDHPDRVVDLCETWLQGASAERRWIVERATRGLVKDGHPRVWGLLGFTARPRVELSEIRLSADSVELGDEMGFSVDLTSTGKSGQRLAVDFAVHFVKANGNRRSKVFKLRVVRPAPGETVELARRISFRPISTRVYYPGRHRLAILVNGKALANAEFEVQERAR